MAFKKYATKSTNTDPVIVLKDPIDYEELVSMSKFKGDCFRRCFSWPLLQELGAEIGGEFNERIMELKPLFKTDTSGHTNPHKYLCSVCVKYVLPIVDAAKVGKLVKKLPSRKDGDVSSTDSEDDCLCELWNEAITELIYRCVFGMYTTEQERQIDKGVNKEKTTCNLCKFFTYYFKHPNDIQKAVVTSMVENREIPRLF